MGAVGTGKDLPLHAIFGMIRKRGIQGWSDQPAVWLGDSLEQLRRFPDEVQDEMGYGLYLAQAGDKHRKAKPLKGFTGAGVLEMISDHAGDTFRAVYAVKLRHAIYVLHAFQKKSKRRIETPKATMNLIRQRLKLARELDENPGERHE